MDRANVSLPDVHPRAPNWSKRSIPSVHQTRLAAQDLASAGRRWRLWWTLAIFDINQKYRRAVIGPFWISISMLATTIALGVVYGAILKVDLATHVPYVAAGFIAWYLVSSAIMDGGSTYIQAERLIKQGGLPLSMHVLRMITRNLLVATHNLSVMLPLYLYFQWVPWRTLPLLLVGVALVAANITWIALIIGPLCTRFRDLLLILTNLVQFGFFLTPVIYHRDALGPNLQWIVQFNPLYYLVEAIRGPLLGVGLPVEIIGGLLVMAIFGWIAAFAFFAHVRARLAYWL